MFTYTKCLIVLYGLYLRTFGKLGFDCLQKDDYTDCKFICGEDLLYCNIVLFRLL